MYRLKSERGVLLIVSLFILFLTTTYGAGFLLAYEAQIQTYKSLEFMKLRVTMEILNSYRNM